MNQNKDLADLETVHVKEWKSRLDSADQDSISTQIEMLEQMVTELNQALESDS